MSCTAETCAFLELPVAGVGGGGVDDVDAVPFVVEGGGVGVGDNLDFWGEKSVSLSVGDCDGEGSSSALGSSLTSVGESETGERRSSLRGSSVFTWGTMAGDGGDNGKLA